MVYNKPSLSLKEINNEVLWNSYLKMFKDANIYQTWNYSKFAQREKNIIHIAIYNNFNEIVAIAAIRIKYLPILNRGIAYIYRGPLWQKFNTESDVKLLGNIFQILRSEFVLKRKLILRIRPFIFSDDKFYDQINIFKDYKRTEALKPYRTIILYLDSQIEEIRKNFNYRWRKGLNKSEKKNLIIKSGNDDKLYTTLIKIYNQMHSRKKYKEYVDVEQVGKMNENLTPEMKLMIFIAYKDNEPIAALTGSALGETGIGLLGGISEMAMKFQASYLLQWQMINYLKGKGCKRYDLGGIDPKNNPGVYYFKQGISEIEVSEIGIFETQNNSLLLSIIKIGERIKQIFSI